MSNHPLPLESTHLHDTSDPDCENHTAARRNGFPLRRDRTCPHCIHFNRGGYRTQRIAADTVNMGTRTRRRSSRATGATAGV